MCIYHCKSVNTCHRRFKCVYLILDLYCSEVSILILVGIIGLDFRRFQQDVFGLSREEVESLSHMSDYIPRELNSWKLLKVLGKKTSGRPSKNWQLALTC